VTERAPALPRRRVGRTALELSVLGLGGAPLGNLFEAIPEARAEATIRAALDAGVGYFDTAPQYGHGRSEHRFGRVLREAPREAFALSTKVGRMLDPVDPAEVAHVRWRCPLPFAIRHDYTRDAALRSVEDSLQRLGLARIDVLYIHDVDRAHQGADYDARLREALDGAVPALIGLRDEGVVGGIGIGVNEVEPCVAFAHAAPLDLYMLAGRYTLLEQGGLDDLWPLAREQGFSLAIAGPFNSGILATGAVAGARHNYGEVAPEVAALVGRLQAVCEAHGVPLGAAAVQFPLGQERVATVVTGAVRPEEIEANVAWMRHEVPPALWDDLRAQGLIAEGVPTP
jgi:D-threo-aldose 1-dehydrogenase